MRGARRGGAHAGPREQPALEPVLRQRAADEEALDLVAAHVGQQVAGHLVLDALRDDPHPEVVRELHDRAGDERLVLAGRHAQHEALVDLQLVQRQLPQQGQRRVAGPEVVHRQPQAQRVQVGEHRPVADALLDDAALGELEGEQLPGDAVPAQRPPHPVDQVRLGQRPRGEVDRDRQRDVLVQPAPAPVQRAVEHEVGERTDPADLLGQADEVVGRDGPVARV
nr:hypothetical protein asmbl_17 [uncultured bacterium]